jgi:glycosyltransferase involved in cell wall biosynthesis
MTICFFGQFDENYTKNKVIIKGLKKNGVDIIFCKDSSKKLLKRFFQLYLLQRKLEFDMVFVPYSVFSLQTTIIARLICWLEKTPLIYDAFVPFHEVYILEKKTANKTSIMSAWLWFLEWASLNLSDLVICDTNGNLKHYEEKYSINKDKLFLLFAGADEEIFKPTSKRTSGSKNLTVGWWGDLLPVHGLNCILNAANKLKNENINFLLFGDSHVYEITKRFISKKKLKNIKVFKNVRVSENPEKALNELEVFLGGPFGVTPRTDRIIPLKVFESLASGMPTIVGETKTMKSTFNSKSVVFSPPENSRQLADNIRLVHSDHEYRKRLSKNGQDWFIQNASTEVIGQILKKRLSKIKAKI